MKRFMFFNPIDGGPCFYATKEEAILAAKNYLGKEDWEGEIAISILEISIVEILKVENG